MNQPCNQVKAHLDPYVVDRTDRFSAYSVRAVTETTEDGLVRPCTNLARHSLVLAAAPRPTKTTTLSRSKARTAEEGPETFVSQLRMLFEHEEGFHIVLYWWYSRCTGRWGNWVGFGGRWWTGRRKRKWWVPKLIKQFRHIWLLVISNFDNWIFET